MLLKYKTVYGQTIYDICLMTYGTLELLWKLIKDNEFGSVDNYPNVGAEFIYDDTLIFDQRVSVSNSVNKVAYVTSSLSGNGQYYSIQQGSLPVTIPTGAVIPVTPPAPTPAALQPFKIFTSTSGLVNTHGAVVYTDTRLVGYSEYPVTASQLGLPLGLPLRSGTDITYDAAAGSFTIIIPDFYLLDGEELDVFQG